MTNLDFIEKLWLRTAKIDGYFSNKDIRYYLQRNIIKKLLIGRIGEWTAHTFTFKYLKKLSTQTNDIFIPLFWKFLKRKCIDKSFLKAFGGNEQDIWRSETFINYRDLDTYLENTNPAYFIQHAFQWVSDRSVAWSIIHAQWQEEISNILSQDYVQKN